MINVTKTFLPPLDEYTAYLKRAWDNEWLTNRGELVLELEDKLKSYLKVSNIILMNNGTIPLQIALKLLAHNGEVITTPFSYIATSASIVWENCTPVFVDIDPDHLTINENKIEEAITKNTTAILATHVFGNPCNVDKIEKIAKKHNLKVIYDAAHTFGVEYNGRSLFNFGDVSTCSFHATKLFHTAEGGALFCANPELYNQCYYSHNFGHNGPTDFHGLGINAKMSELQAALGLTILPYLDRVIEERKKVVDFYFENIDFNLVNGIKIRANTKWNYSYFPIIFKSENILKKKTFKLAKHNIFPRRYFYPSLNIVDYLRGSKMEISESIAPRILCLPLSHNLMKTDLKIIVDVLNG
ncbi:DegT/DnrJ/EryC1/StrS family aminotransferase [Robiginitalea sp. IMCC43444]|uniref:DegT/DnrJ/EryC1/StrS family aminotransferase n=1 Tax=Robiginitalea sp. IMCC43444 TaxID=3459121 RepID=UPI004041D9A8